MPRDRLVVVEMLELERSIEQSVNLALSQTMERYAGDLATLREVMLASQGVLTKHVVARMLDVTAETVMEYVRSRGLKCHRPGRAPLFLLEDVVEWIRKEGGGEETEKNK